MDRKKVVLGVSGGIDSAFTATILQNRGYEVIGVTLICSEEQKNSQDLEDAKKLCKKLNIKHLVVDVIEEFKKEVIDYFIKEYSMARTPSPCIICDEKIKIEKLFEIANKESAYFIATGHYVRKNSNNIFDETLLNIAEDKRKDQGYMLYRIKKEKLKRILFPLAEYNKKEVREKAEKVGIEIYKKKDSQGICFAKEGYIEFLKKNLGEKISKGNYVNEKGEVLGEHQGYQLYTIGQRRGLGVLFPRVYFIVDINPKTNEITLGDYESLYRKKIELRDSVFHISFDKLKGKVLIGRPRFSSHGFKGKIYVENKKIYFEYLEKNPQNAKGQHLVVYYENDIVGGGIIDF